MRRPVYFSENLLHPQQDYTILCCAQDNAIPRYAAIHTGAIMGRVPLGTGARPGG